MKKNLSFESFDRPEILLDQRQQEKIKGGFGVRSARPDLVSSPGSRIVWDGIDIRKAVSGSRLTQQFSIRGGHVTHDIDP